MREVRSLPHRKIANEDVRVNQSTDLDLHARTDLWTLSERRYRSFNCRVMDGNAKDCEKSRVRRQKCHYHSDGRCRLEFGRLEMFSSQAHACEKFNADPLRCFESSAGKCIHKRDKCRVATLFDTTVFEKRKQARASWVYLRHVATRTPTQLIRLPESWEAFMAEAKSTLLGAGAATVRAFLGDGKELHVSSDLFSLPDKQVLYVSAGESFSGLRTNPYVPPRTAMQFRRAVSAAVSRRSTCISGRGVLFSVASPQIAHIRQLALRRVSHLRCLMRRFVSLCLGGFTDSHGTCVSGPAVRLASEQDAFHQSEWHKVAWTKWSLMYLALLEAPYALYVDADVLLLRNPFTQFDMSMLRGHALIFQVLLECTLVSYACSLEMIVTG